MVNKVINSKWRRLWW